MSTDVEEPKIPDLSTLTCIEDAGFILSQRPKADTLAEYKESVAQRCALTWNLYKMGVPLRELNQRYWHLGVKFGVTPAQCAQILAREGRIESQRFRSSLILFPGGFALDMNPDSMVADIRAICRETLGRR